MTGRVFVDSAAVAELWRRYTADLLATLPAFERQLFAALDRGEPAAVAFAEALRDANAAVELAEADFAAALELATAATAKALEGPPQ
jgi:hypothetical protein